MKRLASPKMRHVRALSPYANARGTEQGPDPSKMSFLSMAAGGVNSEIGKNNVSANINQQREEFQAKLEKIRLLQAQKKQEEQKKGGDVNMQGDSQIVNNQLSPQIP